MEVSHPWTIRMLLLNSPRCNLAWKNRLVITTLLRLEHCHFLSLLASGAASGIHARLKVIPLALLPPCIREQSHYTVCSITNPTGNFGASEPFLSLSWALTPPPGSILSLSWAIQAALFFEIKKCMSEPWLSLESSENAQAKRDQADYDLCSIELRSQERLLEKTNYAWASLQVIRMSKN